MGDRIRWAASALVACGLAGCNSMEMDDTTAMGAGVLGAAGVAAVAGEPEVAAGILQGGAQAMTSAATGVPGPSSVTTVPMPSRPSGGSGGSLPPLGAGPGIRAKYEAALAQMRATGRGNTPDAQALERYLKELESDAPVVRK